MSTDHDPAQDRRPQRFGPHVGDVALFIAVAHSDFRGACVLAAALVMPVEGNA